MVYNFTPTPAESTLVNQIFLHADPQKLGVVTGEAAVKVFDGAQLSSAILGEIWALADEDNNGWLSRKGVAVAVRLMGWAQKGEVISESLLQKPGPLPKLEGINSIAQQNTGMSSLPYFPPLTPQDKDKFDGIFLKSGPSNGLLSGERARDIFLKSKLPNEQLLQIWNLADTQDRGNLDATDFSIGMYFIQGLMSKKVSFIPTSLPPGLYSQAGGGVTSHMTGTSGSFSPTTSGFNIQPQYTGQRSLQPNHTGTSNQSRSPALPPRPAIPSIASRSLSPPVQAASPAWDVTAAEKANADKYFGDLDKEGKGYIEGGVAVPFMLQSGLPGEVLANIWDLADLNNDGKLMRDGFAVAMHLIQKKMTGGEVPTSLPASLIPPSMRRTQQEPQQDLFSFDDSPPSSAVQPQATGSFSTLQPQRTGPLPSLAPQPTGSRAPSAMHDPFTSSITPTYTGSPRNLLDDDDHEPSTSTSPPLHDQSAEIGNVKNQLASTNISLEKTRAEREALEQTLASQAAQLSGLQIQLSSAKAAYETEIKLFGTLKDRHTTQQAEIEKVRQELITAESELSAKRVEKAEIEGSFMRDKEDHRELNRRMIEVGQQTETIKAEIEKVKKDAKQQKGLLAIAKKQLAAKEAEKAKAVKELQEANEELEAAAKETEETESAVAKIEMPVPQPPAPVRSDTLAFAAAQPLPGTPDLVASPSVSIKSNNPFERLAMGGSLSRSQSPFTPFGPTTKSPTADTSIDDDIFGFVKSPPSEEGGSQSVEGLPYDKPESRSVEVNGLSIAAPQQPPLSPNETEMFHTPPTSARALSPEPVQGSLDAVSSKFPPIDSVTAPVPEASAAKPTNGHSNVDDVFGSKIQELEANESDSDSDSDDDEVPLAVLSQTAAKQAAVANKDEKGKEVAQPPANEDQSFDNIFASSPTTNPAETTTSGAEGTFDDIFNPAPAPQPKLEETKPNGQVLSDLFPSIEPAPTVAGVDAFDEALGKIGGSTAPQSTPAPTFSFETAFDDNFDFNAAKSDFPPVGTSPPQQSSAPVETNFDDIFSAPTTVNGHSAAPTTSSEASAKPAEEPPKVEFKPSQAPVSFDDAFTAAPTSSVSPPSPILSNSRPTTSPTPAQAASNNPFPTSSPTASPKSSQIGNKPRPASPLAMRASSPPPRSTSPKPRLSTSSSKDGHEKPKEPAPRHSKLSLRLPFGKKKKQQQQQQHEPMPTSSHLAPHKETPERSVTPATDDDVEPVKQLTDMGFSRSQAVDALEKYGYDVPRALNSLLGAP